MKRAVTFMMAALLAALVQAQDADLFFAGRAPLLLDPSRTGFGPGGRISFIHQDQWMQMPGAWRGEQVTAEWCLRNTRKQVDSWLAAGLVAMRDRQAETGSNRSAIGFLPAIHLRAGERSFLSAGLELRWANGTIGDAGGAWGRQYQDGAYRPELPSGESWATGRRSWLEARAGLSFTLKNEAESRFRRERNILVAGIAADHLGRLMTGEGGAPTEVIPMRLTAHALAELPHEIWANGLFAVELIGQLQGPFRTARLNLYAGKHFSNSVLADHGPAPLGFKAGIGYQLQNALVVNAALDWGRATLGMAYGLSLFNTDRQTSGRRTFELMLQVRLAGAEA